MSKEKIIKRIQNSIEELMEISGDIKVANGSANLEIDIALSKANLIVQEFQLLKKKYEESEMNIDSLPASHSEQSNLVAPHSDEINENIDKPIADAEKAIQEAIKHTQQSVQQSQQDVERGITLAQESVLDSQRIAEEGIAHAQESIMNSQREVEEQISQAQANIEESIAAQRMHFSEDMKSEAIDNDDAREKNEDHPEFGESAQMVGESYPIGKSLNDLIKGAGTLDQKIAHSPIQSLQAAIGINDRFLFIREIFDNDAEKYKETITALDEMENIKQAVDYLSANFKIKKTETSLKFVELIKRRFAK